VKRLFGKGAGNRGDKKKQEEIILEETVFLFFPKR